MKKFYKVRYSGMWLGGKAIVSADSAEQAIEMVRNDPNTANFSEVTAVELPVSDGVLYNDNGDH